MYWKDQLANEILGQSEVTASWLIGLQSRYDSLRVKTIDAKGRVPVIQLSAKSGWIKPKEWANNHLTNLKHSHNELHARLADLGCDPTESRESSTTTSQLETPSQSDPSELEMLKSEVEFYSKLCNCYFRELVRASRGEPISLRAQTNIAEVQRLKQFVEF